MGSEKLIGLTDRMTRWALGLGCRLQMCSGKSIFILVYDNTVVYIKYIEMFH